jgi:hypothetical protein
MRFPAMIRPLSSIQNPRQVARLSPHIFLDFIFETAVGFGEKLRYTPGCSTKKGRENQGGKDATM